MRNKIVVAGALLAAGALGVVLADGRGRGVLLEQSKLSLQEALHKALAEVPDGVVVKAELEKEDGRVVFSMDVAKGTSIVELHVDPVTGAILAREAESEDVSALARGKVTLADAVASALAARPGRAAAAEIEEKKGRLMAEVEVVGSDGKSAEAVVDLETGKVVER
jgi:uncharacterized membrane protein YkoI